MAPSVVRRLSWGLIDQASASITTLCISIAALQGPTAAAAEFAVVFVGFSLATGFCRSITTEPLAPELPGFPEPDVRGHVRAAAMTGLVIGLLAALLCAVLLRPDTTLGLWSLALPLAGVPVDAARAAWIGSRRANRAARLSMTQLAAAGVGVVLTLVTGSAGWAVAPLALVSGLLTVGALFRSGPGISWGRLRPRHWVYAAEWSLTYGLAQSSSLVLATLGSAAAPTAAARPGGGLRSAVLARAGGRGPGGPRVRVPPSQAPGPADRGGRALGAPHRRLGDVRRLVLLLPDAVLAAVLGSTWQEYEPVLLFSAGAVVVSEVRRWDRSWPCGRTARRARRWSAGWSSARRA